MNGIIAEVNGTKYLIDEVEAIRVTYYSKSQTSSLTIFGCSFNMDDGTIENRYGCVNSRNEVVIICDYIQIKIENDYYFCYKNIRDSHDLLSYMFDSNGIPVFRSPKSNRITKFYGYDRVQINTECPLCVGEKDGLYGILFATGEEMLPPIYTEISINWKEKYITTINDTIKQLVYLYELQYWVRMPKDCYYVRRESGLIVIRKDNLLAALNEKGEINIPFIYNRLNIYPDFVIATSPIDQKKAFLSRNSYGFKTCFEIVLNGYEDFLLTSDYLLRGYIKIINNSHQGLFSLKENKILIKPVLKMDYKLFPESIGEGAIGFKINGIYGFMDFEGNILFTLEQFAYIDNDKRYPWPKKYSFFQGFSDGIVKVYLGRDRDVVESYNREGVKIKVETSRYYSICDNRYTKADMWDAMTEGQEGEMPEGFSGDYSFMGH